MKIAKIDAFQVAWSPNEKATQHSGFVLVHTDDGLVGLGEVSPMQGGLASLGIVANDLAPLLIGQDPLDHAVLLDRAMHTLVKLGPEGALTSALAAVDPAIAAAIDMQRPALPPQRPSTEVPPMEANVFHPSRAVHALLETFRDAIWFDESGLSTSDVRQWMQLPAGEYIINGSGGIGWGLAASVGAALGNPSRQVVAIIGDGSALYASEALWTAAHHDAHLLLIVLSNRRYATLNEAAGRLTGKSLDLFTIEPPVIDFSGLATLYSWEYARAANESELSTFLTKARTGIKTNTLLELKFDPTVKPVTAARHF